MLKVAKPALTANSLLNNLTYKNNWIPTKKLQETSNIPCEVLIVGSGLGGGATLSRLCELWENQGAKKIGIIEKGNQLFHSHSLNTPTMNVDYARDQLLPDNSTTFVDRNNA